MRRSSSPAQPNFASSSVSRARFWRAATTSSAWIISTSYYDVTPEGSTPGKTIGGERISASASSTCRRPRHHVEAGRGISGHRRHYSSGGTRTGIAIPSTDPYAYITSNVMGQTVLLELARKLTKLKHLVYASSSSVYGGGNTKLPFSVDDPVGAAQFALCAPPASERASCSASPMPISTAFPPRACAFSPSMVLGAGPTWRPSFSPARSSLGSRSNCSIAARCGATSPISTIL